MIGGAEGCGTVQSAGRWRSLCTLIIGVRDQRGETVLMKTVLSLFSLGFVGLGTIGPAGLGVLGPLVLG